MSTPNRPPLWQVLINAGDPPCTMQEMAAAEIRALRDWLGHCVPISWEARLVICRILTAEADRAERGDA